MLEVRDLLGSRLGYIQEYSDLQFSPKLDSWPDLSFKVPVNSTYTKLLQNELLLYYNEEPYIIKSVDPSRDSSGSPVFSVKAPSVAIELLHKPRQIVGTYIGSDIYDNWKPHFDYKKGDRIKYYGVIYECVQAHLSGDSLAGTQWRYWSTSSFQAELVEIVLTSTEMMDIALRDTGWKIGIVDDDGASRTFSGEWVSVPSLLEEMCTKFDSHVIYHGSTKTIDFVKEPGQDRGVTLEYGKNMTGISKSADSTDFVTKLYVYGDENLTFNEVNIHGPDEHPLYQTQNLQSFILDFGYFLSQGYTEDQIYASWEQEGDSSPFFRIGKLNLSDYIDEQVMLNDSRKQMAEDYAYPQVTYKVNFVNLGQVLEECDEDIDIGDWVIVRDLDLGVDVRVRVVSMGIVPGYPEKSSAELSNKDEYFGSSVASSIEYNRKLAANTSVTGMMRHYINTFTTTINSSIGNLIWGDGQITSVELDEIGTPTGKQTRITPGGLGVSVDFGVTYQSAITGEGVLANTVIADSLRILNVGADGIIIEPQSSGVRLNNTEGIVVQSQDKRFAARMRASNEMGGTSWGFSLWNGDFLEVTITHSDPPNSTFIINGMLTDISYIEDYYSQVGANGRWYIFRGTSIAASGPGVISKGANNNLFIDGIDTGYEYRTDQFIAEATGKWYVGNPTDYVAEYNGESLVFGVNMNGDAYFKGEVVATSGQFHGAVYATSGYFNGDLYAGSLYVNNVNLLKFIQAYLEEATDTEFLKVGNITLNGRNGTITLNAGSSSSIVLNGSTGTITLSGNIQWSEGSSWVRIQYSIDYGTAGPSATWVNSWSSSWTNIEVWAKYSYDAGATWGTPILLQGKTGDRGPSGPSGSDASVTRANIALALLSATSADGIYNSGGVIAIRTSAIEAIVAIIQNLYVGSYGLIRNYTGSDGITSTTVTQFESMGASLVLQSGNNIRLSPANTLYLDDEASNIKVRRYGSWVSLTDLISQVAGT